MDTKQAGDNVVRAFENGANLINQAYCFIKDNLTTIKKSKTLSKMIGEMMLYANGTELGRDIGDVKDKLKKEIKELSVELSPEEKEKILQWANNVMNTEVNGIDKIIDEITDVVFKRYLSKIQSRYCCQELKEPSDAEKIIRLYKIDKFTFDKKENYLDKLKNSYNVLNGEKCNIGLIFHRTKDNCDVYLFVKNKDGDDKNTADRLSGALKMAFDGNFPGISLKDEDYKNVLTEIGDAQSINIISNVATEKSEKFKSQSIEKLLDGCVPENKDQSYYFVLIAESVPAEDIDKEKKKYCDFYTKLSPYATYQKNYTYGEALGIMRNDFANLGINIGVVIGGGIGGGKTDNYSTAESINLTHTIYHVKSTLEFIEKQIKRLDNAKALGLWKFAGYVFSNDTPTVKNVANMYRSLTQGDESDVEKAAINGYYKNKDDDDIQKIIKYIKELEHPQFKKKDGEAYETKLLDSITPTTFITGKEIAYSLNLPRKSVPGFPVMECASFGRAAISLDNAEGEKRGIEIGNVYHMRHAENNKVKLDVDKLTSHVFITGSTGSGKSNTVYQLLEKLKNDGKKFLVVEPTKGEYKSVLGGKASVYGTNAKKTKLLRLNPFSFPKDVQLYAHLDRLIDIFNACWPMYAAMPAVLKDAIERAYVAAGWDLMTSENIYEEKVGIRLFPTFTDVLHQIDVVMNESDYSGESKGDYKGALKTRLKSLTNGIYSLVFGSEELSDAELFDDNVIVDLSEIGPETSSLIMGMLVLKLQEYRMTSGNINASLNHVTVLEEAHNLLKRTSTEQNAEGANLVGKSVEMITNAIAEMRTYGESFIIVDQAPGALDPAAIRNTNTKIVLRLPDFSDRELVGKSIGLNDEQIVELGKLKCGVAAVYQSGWLEPVLCEFEKFTDVSSNYQTDEIKTDNVAGILFGGIVFGSEFSEMRKGISSLKKSIAKTAFPASLKRAVLDFNDSKEAVERVTYEFLEGDSLFSRDKEKLKDIEIQQRILQIRQKYSIMEGEINETELRMIADMLQKEHQRRLDAWMHPAEVGGVR